MGISKVIKKYTGEVIVDLTNDTVTAATLAAGRTAHNKYGDIITGTMTAGGIAALPALNNEGTADDLVQGKELLDSDGQIVVGANPYSKAETDEEINIQSMLIDQIMSSLEGKVSGGSGDGSVETCTVTYVISVHTIDVPTFWYTDAETMTIKSSNTEMATLTVPKNTIITITDWTSNSISSGSCSQIFCYSGNAAYQITGDCTFEYRG